MEPLQLANESLTSLLGWLFYCWPVLLTAPYIPLDWRPAWDYVLAAAWGRIWPLPAALLPAFIPIARDWDQKAPTGPEGYRVGLILATIAVIQLYGLQRNNRDRIATEDRFANLAARFADLFDEIREGRKEAEEERKPLFDAIREGREEARDSFDALFKVLSAFREEALLGNSEPASLGKDQRAIDILNNDGRSKYDPDDEYFLEMLRDKYSNWAEEFSARNPKISSALLGSLFARSNLFTGLIGVSYNFGVDWTRRKQMLFVPEEQISEWIDVWMQRLDEDNSLSVLRSDEIYAYLLDAIESSIRYGIQISISDLIDVPRQLPD